MPRIDINRFQVRLDLDKEMAPKQFVRLRQGDRNGTTIVASIYSHGLPVSDVPDACHFVMRLPDGEHYYRKSATWDSGTATVVVDEAQAASATGCANLAYFQLTYGALVFSTGSFTVTVEPDAVGDAELPEDYDSAIQEAIDNANAAAAAAEEAAAAVAGMAPLTNAEIDAITAS